MQQVLHCIREDFGRRTHLAFLIKSNQRAAKTKVIRKIMSSHSLVESTTSVGLPAQLILPVGAQNHGAQSMPAKKNAFLTAMGNRIKALRAQRGMTRKAVSIAADVSERHLANLEQGEGNASILVLLQVAGALHCPLAELIGDMTTASPEWLLIRELLRTSDDAALRHIRIAIGELLKTTGDSSRVSWRVALIGLRGAGKSTLGALLAEDMGFPFVELSREVEKSAGCSVSEIQALYGMDAYRRYERRALDKAIQSYDSAVIAIPGGLVSDASTFDQLLSNCTTVWLQADPEDHMKRVVAQGDLRPMAASKQAMEDLKSILSGREPFYSKAQHQVNTSAASLDQTFQALRRAVRSVLQLPE